MIYSMNIEYLTKGTTLEKAAHALSAAGFSELDYTPHVENDSWRDEMNRALDIFSKEGLTVHQTHAPFNRYGTYGENYEKYLLRALEATEEMKAEYMVVHGDEYDLKNTEYFAEKAFEYNYNLFAPYAERASKSNIKLAFENVFADCFGDTRFCSRSEEIVRLIEKIGEDAACCCWDFGHAGVAFDDNQPQKIKELGRYIECTHVHDCYGGHDAHLPPLMGNVDWKQCMDALREINYGGNLSFELVYNTIPADLTDAFCAYMKNLGESLCRL